MNSCVEKLALLRSSLHQKGINFYIIPSSDPHFSEYKPDHWQIIRWLTGFTGSVATVVVSNTFAGLWTDSRYFIQAEKQLIGSGFQFIKSEAFQRNDFTDYISENSKPKDRIGVDGRIYSISDLRKLKKRIENKNITIETNCDLITDLWLGRPALPYSTAYDHPVIFSGKERSVKINEVREQMRKHNADYHLLTASDDIMWLLNIRGNDLRYSPLLLSYALIGEEQIFLFIDETKIPSQLAAVFDSLGIAIFPYEKTSEIISSVTEGSSVLLNPSATSVALYNSMAKKSGIIEETTIPSLLKAIKNKTEIGNIGRAMVKDGVALTRFLYWFDINHGKLAMTERSLSDKLLEFRLLQHDFKGPSFATIIAFNKNSALPHYVAEETSDTEIGDRGILLVDSGGQYICGTTDITRTIAIGIPTPRQKKDFTLIIKGHINLALAKFPLGTRGYQLDLAARKAMWEHGINYTHGTGHGVGYFLNVHEGPQSISPADNKTIIEAGMLISNEPAIYREGEYGMRTENLILCYEDEETEFGQFLKFDTVSLCNIDKSLIDKSLLDQREIEWLNSYHSEVYEKLSPFLNNEEKLWLKEKTNPL